MPKHTLVYGFLLCVQNRIGNPNDVGGIYRAVAVGIGRLFNEHSCRRGTIHHIIDDIYFLNIRFFQIIFIILL